MNNCPQVRLHVGNTLWLNDIVTGIKLIDNNDIVGFSLKNKLKNENHAILNDEHISHLLKLCKMGGLLLK